MAVENPYFELLKGKDVSLNEVRKTQWGIMNTVRQLIRDEVVVGQYNFENDVTLYMPSKKERK